jgi:hypothetical protein
MRGLNRTSGFPVCNIIAAPIEYDTEMLESKLRTSTSRTVVGWYSPSQSETGKTQKKTESHWI